MTRFAVLRGGGGSDSCLEFRGETQNPIRERRARCPGATPWHSRHLRTGCPSGSERAWVLLAAQQQAWPAGWGGPFVRAGGTLGEAV